MMVNSEVGIKIKNLNKKFGKKIVLDNLCLDINRGEFITIFGPNGCGKSTLLNILAGVIKQDSGEVIMGSKNLSYIFQNYRESLFPWRTNYENLSFPLEIKGLDKNKISEEIDNLQKIFKLNIDVHSYPYNLSGGQQQILSFFRALITKPEILLIDEALSALDFENNLTLREMLQRYYIDKQPTVLMITHSIEEAVHLGQKIMVLSKNPRNKPIIIENNSNFPREIAYLRTDDFDQKKNLVLSEFSKSISTK